MFTSRSRIVLAAAPALAAGLLMSGTAQANVIYSTDQTFDQPEDLAGDNGRVEINNGATVTMEAPDGRWTNYGPSLQIQPGRGAVGTLTIDGVDQPDYGTLWVGYAGGDGTVNLHDASMAFTENVSGYGAYIGGNNSGVGVVNISGSAASLSVSHPLSIGRAYGNTSAVDGTLNQSGGSVIAGIDIAMDGIAGSSGVYNISGGDLSAGGDLRMDGDGVATFHVDGSGATSITIGGTIDTGSNSTLKFTIDDGGVTAIGVGESQDALSGTVDLGWAGGATPAEGTFDLVVRSGGTGLIDISELGLADGQDAFWSLDNSTEGVVQATYVIPEPASLSLVVAGLALLASRRRRR